MTNINTTNLADWMRKNAIGMLDQVERSVINHHALDRYPPHSILALNNDEYILTLAVAGFAKDELKVEVDDGFLTVSGSRDDYKLEEGARYIHQGISQRDFTKKWQLQDHMEVTKVALENGILAISLKINKPESKKPRVIDIL